MILCYHAVNPHWSSPLSVAPEVFREHLEWLVAHRRPVPLATLLDSGRPVRRDEVALTFDDGFADLYSHAVPLLEEYKVPATVFIVARTLFGEPAVTWVDDPPRDFALEVLSADQVLDMRDRGIDFGSHTWSHPDLTTRDPSSLERELVSSRAHLEELLDRPVRVLAYPRGRHDRAVRDMSEAAGYRFALSLPEGPEPTGRFAIPRVGVFGANGIGTLRVKAEPWYLRARMSRAGARARSVASTVRSRARR